MQARGPQRPRSAPASSPHLSASPSLPCTYPIVLSSLHLPSSSPSTPSPPPGTLTPGHCQFIRQQREVVPVPLKPSWTLRLPPTRPASPFQMDTTLPPTPDGTGGGGTFLLPGQGLYPQKLTPSPPATLHPGCDPDWRPKPSSCAQLAGLWDKCCHCPAPAKWMAPPQGRGGAGAPEVSPLFSAGWGGGAWAHSLGAGRQGGR